jgi:hypothetical protein
MLANLKIHKGQLHCHTSVNGIKPEVRAVIRKAFVGLKTSGKANEPMGEACYDRVCIAPHLDMPKYLAGSSHG